MNSPKLHQKQFVFSKKKEPYIENWSVIDLQSGWYISVSPDLPVSQLQDANLNTWYLLGWAVPTRTPEINISKANSLEQVENITHFWAGRWCLIGEECIVTDASNLICLMYSEKGIIASSPILLHQILTGRVEMPSTDFLLNTKYYHNWYLLPNSGYDSVKKLLPGQKIKLSKSSFDVQQKIIELHIENDYESLYNELCDSFINEILYLKNVLKLKINVALSSGYDSRLIYAIVSSCSNEFASYTHVFPSMKPSDYRIPQHINASNHFIHPNRFDSRKLELYDLHSGLHAVDTDRILFAHGQWDGFKSDEVSLRGGILELAGKSPAHLYDKLPELRFTNQEDSKSFSFAMHDFRPFQMEALRQYFDYGKTHSLLTSFNKQYYLDQRLAGWLSYIEQSLTITNTLSYHPGNSVYQINLMKNFPENILKVKGFHIDFIYRNQPKLLDYPFNPSSYKDKLKLLINSKIFKKAIFR